MSWLAHCRYAARVLRKSPLFSAIAVASLALGIGANIAIFSLLDQILFRTLPVRDPGQLVLLQSANPIAGGYHGDSMLRLFSYPMYSDLRGGLGGGEFFEGLVAECPIDVSLDVPGQAEAASGALVSGNFFGVLGVRPAVGRLLATQDDTKKAHAVAVLGYGFWTRHFGADPSIIGRQMRVNSTLVTVAGVAPEGFYGVSLGTPPDIYLPLSMQEQTSLARIHREDRNQHWLHILGRLKPGVAPGQAAAAIQRAYQPALRSELATVPANLPPMIRQRLEKQALLLKPGSGGIPAAQEEAQPMLYLLMAMAGLVLLIACINVANLMVARGLDRQKEIGVRLALGARSGDVARQILAESLILSGFAAGIAVLIAVWTTAWMLHIAGSDASWISADPDRHALLAAITLAIGTGILSGLLPALQSTRPKLYPVLKDQAASVLGGRSRSRRALVVAQVALSLLLVVGAGLFMRTLANLRNVNPGFRTDHLAMFNIDAR